MTEKEPRELDAWIAEYVMGYERRISKSSDSPLIAAFSDKDYVFENWKTKDGFVTLPKYTTDPAAAMEVLKQCAKKLRKFRFHIYGPIVEGEKWLVSDCEWHRKESHDGIGETLEIAICIFAQKLFTK